MDLIKLPPFTTVGAGKLATLSTTILNGMSVHAIHFEMGGTTFTKANITSLKCLLNSKALLSDITGDKLQSMNTQKGLADDANYLSLYFGNPASRTIKGQHITDLDLSLYPAPLEIQVQIDATAVDPTLEAYAWVQAPKGSLGLGYTPGEQATLKAWIRSVANPANAVNKMAFNIGMGSRAGALIESVNFFHSNLESVEIKKDGTIIFENPSIGLLSHLQNDYGRSPQAGLYVWQPTVDGNTGQAVATVGPKGHVYSMQTLLTTSAADTVEVFAELATALPLI